MEVGGDALPVGDAARLRGAERDGLRAADAERVRLAHERGDRAAQSLRLLVERVRLRLDFAEAFDGAGDLRRGVLRELRAGVRVERADVGEVHGGRWRVALHARPERLDPREERRADLAVALHAEDAEVAAGREEHDGEVDELAVQQFHVELALHLVVERRFLVPRDAGGLAFEDALRPHLLVERGDLLAVRDDEAVNVCEGVSARDHVAVVADGAARGFRVATRGVVLQLIAEAERFGRLLVVGRAARLVEVDVHGRAPRREAADGGDFGAADE